MKLRHMTAEVVELQDVVIEENRHGETIYHIYDSVKALKSYNSIVAMATSDDLFMLPRYDYSPPTLHDHSRREKKHDVSIKLRSPVYAVYGKDEGDRTVAITYVHSPNQINTVRSMLFLEHEEVVFTEVRIEAMKFDGWKVIG